MIRRTFLGGGVGEGAWNGKSESKEEDDSFSKIDGIRGRVDYSTLIYIQSKITFFSDHWMLNERV